MLGYVNFMNVNLNTKKKGRKDLRKEQTPISHGAPTCSVLFYRHMQKNPGDYLHLTQSISK